jgi:hypothetical protein
VLLQLELVAAVEAQTAYNRNDRNDNFEYSDPDVGEMDAVGLFTVFVCRESRNGDNPDDETGGDELEDAIPDALCVCVSSLPGAERLE